jgi:8-oxo-dGTP pyrophosphatase MutT (NUDIX family)
LRAENLIARLTVGQDNIGIRSNEDARPKNRSVEDKYIKAENRTGLTRAAVLVPIISRDDGLKVLLTKRAKNLKNHPGQISFPGGSVDDTDLNAQHTALRETEEEVGLDPSHVEVIGQLDQYIVGTGYLVSPVIGLIKPPFKLIRQEAEVAEIFEVPLDFLIEPKNFKRYAREFNGTVHHHFSLTWQSYFIWGATAGMLRNLSERLLNE